MVGLKHHQGGGPGEHEAGAGTDRVSRARSAGRAVAEQARV